MHEWKPADDTGNLICRQVMDDIEIGVYPVLYGYRVRAGQIGDLACVADWCCAGSHGTLQWAYGFLKHVLQKNAELGDPWRDIPRTSQTKPIIIDPEFLRQLAELRSRYGRATSVELPELKEIQNRWIAQHF